MRFLQLLLLPLFIAACDGAKTNYMNGGPQPVPPIQQKPTACKMDFAQTCWSKTIDKVTKCIAASNTSDTFSTDKEFCSNAQTDKLIHFSSPADIFTRPFDVLHEQVVQFKVYPDSVNECFSVTGSGDNFEVKLKKTGESVYFNYDKTAMSFSCLDGQNVSIDTNKIDGCQKSLGGEFAQQVPGMVFEPIVEDGIKRGWTFRFRGAPNSPDVFRCYYP